MKCGIPGCAGEYEERHIVHTLWHEDHIVVMDHVPAELCSECGDVLLKPQTLQHIDYLPKTGHKPVGTAPLYEYTPPFQD